MLPTINGRAAWVFTESNFDIDLIVGVDNIKIKDVEQLKEVCMKDYDPDFTNLVREGDVLVGGENFGYGHPHYPSFIALRALGIKAVIAESFSPGFYRGESNNGFPLIECPEITKHVNRWDTIALDWQKETITIIDQKKTLPCSPIPKKTKDLIEYGGVMGFLRAQIQTKEA
ncbi:3-isopropylmalate dehydratase [Mesobacillus maritimus]|uniref:LeuD/DmdB family oxidoreductase small subunit n=1 Tax=Mesobacillus maritimus TaxID=1643336 RepID=UPI00203D4632|nr:3-isopropylmalate dehydratase [Mesobacillus maritimus]MCM3670951.1 3-isopropylmalate dehydratase [Mesobacillus maritimus]